MFTIILFKNISIRVSADQSKRLFHLILETVKNPSAQSCLKYNNDVKGKLSASLKMYSAVNVLADSSEQDSLMYRVYCKATEIPGQPG